MGFETAADRATILAAAISEGLNTGAFVCLLMPVSFAVLGYFAVRGRLLRNR